MSNYSSSQQSLQSLQQSYHSNNSVEPPYPTTPITPISSFALSRNSSPGNPPHEQNQQILSHSMLPKEEAIGNCFNDKKGLPYFSELALGDKKIEEEGKSEDENSDLFSKITKDIFSLEDSTSSLNNKSGNF